MQTRQQAGGHQGEIRNSARLALWTLAWVATLALARFGPSHLWDSQPAASWAAIAVNVAVGIGWIVVHARFLHAVDELQRKINLDALAVALGVGWVAGFAYVVVDGADLIARDVNVALLPILMSAVYVTAIVVGNMRYR